jgi:hypothetical protein
METNAVLPVHEYGACKIHWVHEVCGKMRISQADLFATMALILTNLVSSWDAVRKRTCVESANKSCWTTASTLAVLQQIYDAALALASERSPHSDFMELFLTAACHA